MKLIDANNINKFCQERQCADYGLYNLGYQDCKDQINNYIDNIPKIDPVHAAGGCYCKVCLHSEPVAYEDNKGWVTPIDEYWCNKHKDTMPLNGFCSEGRKDDMKNG